MAQMERKEGYYWVKSGIGWIIAEWHERKWRVTQCSIPMSENPFSEINETRIPSPDEVDQKNKEFEDSIIITHRGGRRSISCKL